MKFKDLVAVYDKLDNTSKRLAKTYYISEILKIVKDEDMDILVTFLSGSLFSEADERKLGVSVKLVIKAVAIASGFSPLQIEKKWAKIGDLGDTTKEMIDGKTQKTLFSEDLSIKKVYDNIMKIATISGESSVDKKIKLIAELMSSSSGVEAKFIARIVLEDLRLGVGEGTIRDAVLQAYLGDELNLTYNIEDNKLYHGTDESGKLISDISDNYRDALKKVQEAIDLSNEISLVAKILKNKGLEGLSDIKLSIGRPVKVMLFPKVQTVSEAFERVGMPAAFEYKYDGFRMQIHINKDDIILYTRRLENVTKQFPDVIEAIKENVNCESAILDCEAVGYDKNTKKYLPFQSISQRIRRKHNIEEVASKFPVELNVFDLIYYNGKNHLKSPFGKRREIIERIINAKERVIIPSAQIITDKVEEGQEFYDKALEVGNEGIMVKNLGSIYKPGARVGYGVKLKPTMENLDLVIIEAERGEGKRSNWFSSFTVACRNSDGEYMTIGRVGTGLKELEEEGLSFAEMTRLIEPLIVEDKGKIVRLKPEIVIEIAFEEIQKSTTYSSGFALRFPRVIRNRTDERSAQDASTLYLVEDLYNSQRGRGEDLNSVASDDDTGMFDEL